MNHGGPHQLPGLQSVTGESDVRPEVDSERAPPGAVLLEFAWEVCNQVGGIYQVLRSKAPRMINRWRNRYWVVGPYVESKAALDFELRRPTGWIAGVIEALAREGLVVHHGRWLIPGRPRALLIDHRMPRQRLDEVKYRIWQDHGIEFPLGQSDALIDGVVSFADGARRLLRAVCDRWRGDGDGDGASAGGPRDPLRPERRVLAHFHEWLGGLAIPMVRREGLPVAVVFTTHATLLGRCIAASDDYFYDHLPFVNEAADAARFNIRTQHGIERACAHGADVFTTVSPITGEECSQLLGRAPDLVLPNGLNIDRYNVGHDFQTFHAQYKERINRFVMGHFFPSYSFDLDKTLYVFTSGRFEPKNKGFDLCLEAMARLNAELKAAHSDRTVIFFIVTQRPTRSFLPQALESQGVLNELRQVCEAITTDLRERLFRQAAAGKRVNLDSLVGEYWRLRFRRTQHALRTGSLPPVVTHVLEDEWTDPLLSYIRMLWISNRHDDPVKVVYHPDFINPVNPLWGMEYDQFVRGCHLGIFPSAYEPWGYTPLECIAMGVPAITSDLAGFGRYVAENLPDHDQWGLTVLRRRGRSYQDAAADLCRHLLEFCGLDRRGRIRLRNEVERRSWEFDWSNLGKAYDWAHDLAMARAAAGAER
jgi:glycogen(starch) synthase